MTRMQRISIAPRGIGAAALFLLAIYNLATLTLALEPNPAFDWLAVNNTIKHAVWNENLYIEGLDGDPSQPPPVVGARGRTKAS